ncbi:MAG: hypothetical protein MZV64_73675 [Ignavibacteriales bacterium]|nr:hypothetical protein [Ignavibacteriales bacterium]
MPPHLVAVIDDDASVRRSLMRLLQFADLPVPYPPWGLHVGRAMGGLRCGARGCRNATECPIVGPPGRANPMTTYAIIRCA